MEITWLWRWKTQFGNPHLSFSIPLQETGRGLEQENSTGDDLLERNNSTWERVDLFDREESYLNFDVLISVNTTLLAASTTAGCTLYSYVRGFAMKVDNT